jgi:hypothetical protein
MLELRSWPLPEHVVKAHFPDEEKLEEYVRQPLVKVRLIQCWTHLRCWEVALVANVRDKDFYLDGCNYLGEGRYDTVEAGRVPVSRRWAEKLFRDMKSARVSVYSPPPRGYDGGFTELEVIQRSGRVLYRWWCDAGEDWAPLQKLRDRVFGKYFAHVEYHD